MKLEIETQKLRDALHDFLGTDRYVYKAPLEEKRFELINILMIGGITDTNVSLEEMIEKYLQMAGVHICGGSVLSALMCTKINDLDMYLTTPENGNLERVHLLFKFMLDNEVWTTRNARSYSRNGTGRKIYRVQVITRFFGAPSEIFKTFDFTVTQAAFWIGANEFVFGERFFPDLASRTLIYQGGSAFPICALYRTKKYEGKGFHVPGSTLMHIGLSIVQLDIQNYRQLKDQLHGIDTMFLGPLLEAKDDELPVNIGEFLKDALDAIYNWHDDSLN